jgi:hypothetical protein
LTRTAKSTHIGHVHERPSRAETDKIRHRLAAYARPVYVTTPTEGERSASYTKASGRTFGQALFSRRRTEPAAQLAALPPLTAKWRGVSWTGEVPFVTAGHAAKGLEWAFPCR